MTQAIAGSATTADSQRLWLRRFGDPREARVRLVCFAHAGGSASLFRSWARWLAPDVELLAVRYPGRQDRLAEPCLLRLDDMVDAITAVLSTLPGPLAFFGHSMGTALAYLTAARLEDAGGPRVTRLFVSAGGPPHVYRPGRLHELSDDDLVAEIGRLGAADSELLRDPEMRALLLPPIRADFTMLETCGAAPVRTIGAPVTAYGGTEDAGVSPADLDRWSELTRSGFDRRVFEGGHFYLMPHERDLVEDIAGRL